MSRYRVTTKGQGQCIVPNYLKVKWKSVIPTKNVAYDQQPRATILSECPTNHKLPESQSTTVLFRDVRLIGGFG